MKRVLTAILVASSLCVSAQDMPVIFGEKFADTAGQHINAHGGNILRMDSTYYWYGEHRGDGSPGTYQKGVTCYSSQNLRDWDYRGIVLAVSEDQDSPITKGCTIERPKVVYCPTTGKYVMWFHNELKGQGYRAAFAGVATSDSPLGPFKLKRSGRVNAGIPPLNLTPAETSTPGPQGLEWWTPEWSEAINHGMFTMRDLEGGQMSRDMTVFVDPDDGKAYHVYSSEDNLTIHIAELDSTYENHTGRYIRIFPAGHNEAPAIFKHDGKYWMITSGCTGWAPNTARLMSADSMMGEWTQHPNPCKGPDAEITFGGQSTYVFQQGDCYTFMADIWNPKNLADSRHIWLPIQFGADGVPFIQQPARDKDMSAYLMVFFTDPTHDLFMATSPDGYTFTAVNDNKPVIAGDSIAEQKGIRDPHITRGPDGAFYLAMTDLHIFAKDKGLRDTEWERPREEYGWGNNRSLVLMKSCDLIHWNRSNLRIDRLFPEEFGDIGCAWAPETTYDPESKRMMIYFTMRHGNGRSKLYYAFTDNDFTTLVTKPEILFEYPNENIQVLDADIIPTDDGRWCLTYVAQDGPSGIKHAIGNHITGPWEYIDDWVDFEPRSCEAPNMWKRIGSDKWVVMYDIFGINPHNFGFAETSDFMNFTNLGRFNEGIMKAVNFSSPKHGAVIPITQEEKDRLESYWNDNTDSAI